MAYLVYEYSQDDTFSGIATAYQIPYDELLRINNISMPCPYKPSEVPFLNGTLIIREIFSGNKSGDTIDTELPEFIYNKNDTKIFNPSTGSGLSNTVVGHFAYKKCYFTILNGPSAGTYYLPCFPESYSDSYSANITSESILGRSEPFQIYQNGGPRKVSANFKLHREMFIGSSESGTPNLNRIDEIIAAFQSLAYPTGDDSILPRVKFVIGNSCSIEGIIDGSVDVTWSETINANSTYNMAEFTISIIECTGNPKTAGDIFYSRRLG